jgi:hypothetical protein
MSDPVETGILIDHDEGLVYIDTRRKKIITRMERLGFKPFQVASGYHRYKISDKELTVVLRKKVKKGPVRPHFGKNKPILEPERGQSTPEAKEGEK